MKICISADHGGFELKKIIIEHIKSMGLNVDDLNDNESVSYTHLTLPTKA